MILRLVAAFLLAFCASAAQAGWHKAVSQSFIVYGDTDERQLRSFVRDVERFATMLRLRSGAQFDPDAPKLTIFVLGSVDAVQRVHGGSNNVAGFYTANVAGTLAVVPRRLGDGGRFDLDAQTILYHEYAHHFMLQYFPTAYPAWYVEGFAEFYSTTKLRDDGTTELGHPALHRAYSVYAGELFPLGRMLATETKKMSADEVSRFYATAWLLTHYLSFDKARAGQLTSYLNAFAKGEGGEKAAADAFGDLAILERDLLKYRRATAARIMTMVVKGMQIEEPAITVTALGAADGAAMPLYVRSMRESRSKAEVESFVVEVRKFAARYPGQPIALEMLAEAELDAEQLGAASTANDALLALRPEDPRALLRRGRIAGAQMLKGGFAGGWPAVRRLIVRANRAAPNDPYPLYLFFESFRREGVRPPELAFDGVRRALELAPQSRRLRGIVAARLIADGKRDTARSVLAPMLNDPHSAAVRERARAMLDGTPQPGKEAEAEDKDAAGAH